MRKGSCLLFFLLCCVVLYSCNKHQDELPRYVECNTVCLEEKVNHNLEFLAAAVAMRRQEMEVVSVSSEYYSGDSETLIVTAPNGRVFTFDNLSLTKESLFPPVGIRQEGNLVCWTFNDTLVRDEQGNVIALDNAVLQPRFMKDDTAWFYSIDGQTWSVVDASILRPWSMSVTLSERGDYLFCDLIRGDVLLLPVSSKSATFNHFIPNRGFYKDIFMDAGVALTTRSSLAAADYLDYSLECVSGSEWPDTVFQNQVLGGCAEDENGRLLFPDGQPRYRILFVCGGNSRSHSKALSPSARDRMRDFVRHGGGYVGTCAGAFMVGMGYDTVSNYPYYLALWPGVMKHSGLGEVRTGMLIDESSSLLRYYDFGGDHYVANVRHNAGGWPSSWPKGTEVLARYDYPVLPAMHRQPSAWAYKPNNQWGRIVMEGSHPEEVTSGERRDFTAALICYAADGVGLTSVKGELRRDCPREMVRSSSDGQSQYTCLGDRQYHHFVVYIPAGARNISFHAKAQMDCDLRLALSHSTYAYSDVAKYLSIGKGSEQDMSFLQLEPGLWYLSVQCLSTVTARNTEKGQEYSGRTDLLNGVPYTIWVTWE